MDAVVYIALVVLAIVFLFSLFVLIVMFKRRYEYNRMLSVYSLRFTKLTNTDDIHNEGESGNGMDDVVQQLGPHICK